MEKFTLAFGILMSLLIANLAAALPPGVKPLPGVDELPSVKELPDPFLFNDGSRVKSREDWSRRREEIKAAVFYYEYGHMPPAPGNVKAVEIISDGFHKLPVTHKQYKVTCGPEGKVSFVLDVMIPKGKGPFPIILRGDWCWGKLSDEITAEVIKRGYILAEFNRCELAPDNKNRDTGVYPAYPEYDWGAEAAWAWGFQRCVDVFMTLDFVDKTKIAITGHSRGGKAVQLAGATDERVALTAPNGSGCGGAGCFRFQAPKSEDLGAILKNFTFWFGPRAPEFVGKVDRLPFDQHSIKALVAPRAYLTTDGLADLWANPEGTRQSHAAAKEVFKFLGAAEKIGIHYREGGHEHGAEDFAALLDFADQIFYGRKSTRNFDANPFPDSPKMFNWSAPE